MHTHVATNSDVFRQFDGILYDLESIPYEGTRLTFPMVLRYFLFLNIHSESVPVETLLALL
jgi:hypothetical protein